MPSKILTDLAPELIIQILKFSDNFADLTALSSTSRKIFIIWKMTVDAICEAILPRTVRCFAQALELLAAQEEAEGDEHSIFGYQSSRLLRKSALDFWTVDGLPFEKIMLTLAENTDFIRAYYRATTLATLGEERLPSQLLASWNMLDFEQVMDVMFWLRYFCTRGQQQDLSVWYDNDSSNRTPAGTTFWRGWESVFFSMENLKRDFYELRIKPKSSPGQGTNTEASLSPFILLDHYQNEYRSHRDGRLADLLPLVRKQGCYYNVKYKLTEA